MPSPTLSQLAARVGWIDLDLAKPDPDGGALQQLVASSAALVGLHPDQATEPIVRCASRARKSWAVVPCCVFAADFPDRFLPGRKAVATYDDLCGYLQALGDAAARSDGERVRRARLDFQGRNQVLYQIFDA